MDATGSGERVHPALPDVAVQVNVSFFTALFDQNDIVLFRPIETWTERGRKRSRVDYKNTCYPPAVPQSLERVLHRLVKLAESEAVNLFFGVCPRKGGNGRFDFAWQIRTVRALWTDIDRITIDEALGRVTDSRLPAPSITVNSGNGVHLYWLLEQPYLIDDAPEPPPVETEWILGAGGRQKPRRYLLEHGDRVYLDQRRHVSRLSEKAEHIQDVLAGIAQAVGGDHTTDLTRLLRVPGTLNRKNQRSGDRPLPTALVECEPSRRYPIALFEPFKGASPATQQAKQIAAMPLPAPRKPSPKKLDELAERIAAAGIAPAGRRSEADFAVCCHAIRNGISRDDVWPRVEQIGKFAEQGRRYFDMTWENAEYDVRSNTCEKLQKRCRPVEQAAIPAGDEGVGADHSFSDEDQEGSGRPRIVVEPATTPVAVTLGQITDQLLYAGDCFSRAEQLVVVHDSSIKAVLSSQELAGLLSEHVEFFFVDDEAGEYKPLPAAYANTWLNNHVERGRLPAIKLFTRNPVYTCDWRMVRPGFDEASGIYYAGPPVESRSETPILDALLQDFCFRSPADRSNYIGMLLTAIAIPHFVGSKPAALFNGNQPELGKTILAQIIAILRDGHPAETASYNANDEEFEKRLGAIVRRGVTTIIIDNAKARGRSPRIESACLERSITDPILSFRLLGYSQEIRAENSHIFCITANAPDVSRDLVTRCVVINLYHEGDPERRTFSIADPEGYAEQHRIELLGELVGMIERWKAAGMPKASVQSRFNKRGWGTIIGGILEACGEPDFLANAMEAASLLDETLREFTELVGVLAEHPQGIWSATELADLCGKHGLLKTDLGEGSMRSMATKLGTLAGRFVGERFRLPDCQVATFHRADSRKGKVYRVLIEDELPNLEGFAEPLPNHVKVAGSAP